MPFDAAKGIAATFCYHIRYALTPVFGLEFLSLCIPPEDPAFGAMVISPDTVRQSTEVANAFRELYTRTSQISSPQTPSSADFAQWTSRSHRHRPVRILSSDNECGTDTERSDKDLSPPQTPMSLGWTPLNRVVERASTRRGLNHQQASPRTLAETAIAEYSQSRASSSSEGSRGLKRSLAGNDEDYDEDSHLTHSSEDGATPPKRRKKSTALTTEAKAAYMLMQLSMKDATLGESESPGNRRRASS